MRNFIKVLASGVMVSALAIVTFAQTALADPRDFVLENDSSSIIRNVYVTPTSSCCWGYDVLGDNFLFAGDWTRIRFTSSFVDTCYYDIKLVTINSQPSYLWNVDLCITPMVTYT
ncbi:MAG: hypothetical protein JO352_20290 [Chloroflexi bacterium]|nr:hypothetical protein [Solirubrobacterales bacterium]MBV9326112.1 hypothetical protein [Chloroflexota bacterium]MBV9597482.1 hypothetical protein [Chloroflexota bacterium]